MSIPYKSTLDLDVDYYCQMNNLPVPVTPIIKKPTPIPPPSVPPVVNKPAKKQILPSEQCGITSCSMLLNYWYQIYDVPSITKDDIVDLIKEYDSDFVNGNSTRRRLQELLYYKQVITTELANKGLSSLLEVKAFPTNVLNAPIFKLSDYEKILSPLDDDGYASPIMILTKIHPPFHFIVIKGINYEKNCYIVNDPYFIPKEFKDKLNPQTYGQNALYSIPKLNAQMFRSYCVYIKLKSS